MAKPAKPNFFLVGAPKCGTSSLYDWLRQHPNVFLPKEKEPHFFNSDHRYPGRLSMDEYNRLFDGAAEDHTAIGEASVWYLASRDAVPAILEYNPEARFIVCVRNPVEMAPALHHQQVYNGNEDISGFRAAWDAQPERERGAPVLAAERRHLMYGPLCKVGSQIERLISVAGREQVHIAFLEDMRRDPRTLYAGVARFLGLPAYRPEFRKLNEAKGRRSMLVRRMARGAGRLKRAVGAQHSLGLLGRLDRWNQTTRPWQMDPSMHGDLTGYFEQDIALLETITGRDLSHWRRARQDKQAG